MNIIQQMKDALQKRVEALNTRKAKGSINSVINYSYSHKAREQRRKNKKYSKH